MNFYVDFINDTNNVLNTGTEIEIGEEGCRTYSSRYLFIWIPGINKIRTELTLQGACNLFSFSNYSVIVLVELRNALLCIG